MKKKVIQHGRFLQLIYDTRSQSFGHGQFSRTPPSMISSVPVMLLESSDSRNLAARATSSDVPNRFKSDLATIVSSNADP